MNQEEVAGYIHTEQQQEETAQQEPMLRHRITVRSAVVAIPPPHLWGPMQEIRRLVRTLSPPNGLAKKQNRKIVHTITVVLSVRQGICALAASCDAAVSICGGHPLCWGPCKAHTAALPLQTLQSAPSAFWALSAPQVQHYLDRSHFRGTASVYLCAPQWTRSLWLLKATIIFITARQCAQRFAKRTWKSLSLLWRSVTHIGQGLHTTFERWPIPHGGTVLTQPPPDDNTACVKKWLTLDLCF